MQSTSHGVVCFVVWQKWSNAMTDHVKNWVSNARGAEYGFFKAVQYALEQFGEKNNLPMYALIAFTNGKKYGGYKIEDGYSLKQFSAPLKRILNVALSDVKFTFKDGKAGVVVGDNGGLNREGLEKVSMLAASKSAVRSTAFDNAFPKPEVAPKEFDVLVWVERQLKTNPDHLEVMIAALQARRSGLKVAA
jgi:hypothetical protein